MLRRGERVTRNRRDMRCVGRFVEGLHIFGSGVIERGAARNDAIQALGEVAIPIERGRGRLDPNVIHYGVGELFGNVEDAGANDGGLESMSIRTRRAKCEEKSAFAPRISRQRGDA